VVRKVYRKTESERAGWPQVRRASVDSIVERPEDVLTR
jgi:hypothetical protein